MNNEITRNHFDAFQRMAGFSTQKGSAFAANSRAISQFAIITAVAAEMEKEGVAQLSGSGEFHGGTSSKEVYAKNLRTLLAKIRETADGISEAEDLPDFDDQFRMSRSRAYGTLLTTAREFLAEATKHKALFLQFEMDEDFLDDLEDDIGDLEKAVNGQNSGLSGQVGGTAALQDALKRGIKARTQLLPIVRNKFSRDPAILAQWETAARVERPRRKPKSKSEAPPTPDAG